ncbi:MAG: hypothetical protein ACI8RD_005900, partial [Bacillariaceae sp.]
MSVDLFLIVDHINYAHTHGRTQIKNVEIKKYQYSPL